MSQNNQLTGTWDGAQLSVVIGALPLKSLSDGDSVIFRRNNPLYNSRAGNDGAVGRARVTDKRAQFEIRTQQTASVNDELSAMFNMDSITEEGQFVGPIMVKDLSGRTVISAGQAWLMSLGDVGFESGAVGERTWTFECADSVAFIGGNR